MKITNVKVDICKWPSSPWKTGVGTTFGGTQQLGIVTVETDEGVSGNAFLGSSRMGAHHFAPPNAVQSTIRRVALPSLPRDDDQRRRH